MGSLGRREGMTFWCGCKKNRKFDYGLLHLCLLSRSCLLWHESLNMFIIIIISSMELGHLLTRSGLTYSEISSKVYHDSFCQLGSSISLSYVIYFEAFYLHFVP